MTVNLQSITEKRENISKSIGDTVTQANLFLNELYESLRKVDLLRSDQLHLLEDLLDCEQEEHTNELLALTASRIREYSNQRRIVKQNISLVEKQISGLEIVRDLVQTEEKLEHSYRLKTTEGVNLYEELSEKGAKFSVDIVVPSKLVPKEGVFEPKRDVLSFASVDCSLEHPQQNLAFLLDIDSGNQYKLMKTRNLFTVKENQTIIFADEEIQKTFEFISAKNLRTSVDSNILDEVFTALSDLFRTELKVSDLLFEIEHNDNYYKLYFNGKIIFQHKRLTTVLNKIKRLPMKVIFPKNMANSLERSLKNYPNITYEVA